jgi:DNA-binding response OmpR family regulator
MAKILVADDEQFLREMVAFKLGNAGHEVVVAVDGAEALRLASTRSPDLILLDVMMPGLDGFEVLRRIKGDAALSRIPVIMLTAKGQERDVVAGLGTGAADYVVKPFSLKELTMRIDKALSGRAQA